MKYTIHSTKEDYQKMYSTLEKLESEYNMTLDWKKIKRATLDSLMTLPDIMKRTHENRKLRYNHNIKQGA